MKSILLTTAVSLSLLGCSTEAVRSTEEPPLCVSDSLMYLERIAMPPDTRAIEASGDPGTALFNKGDLADATVRGETLPECTINKAPANSSIRATGNEPPWIATVEGDQLTLITDYGATTRTAPVLTVHRGASVTRYRAAGDELGVSLNLRPGVCKDSMTGMPYPYFATLASPPGVLHGCAGQPSDLLAGHTWEVISLDGQAPLRESSMTLQFFPEDGTVAGFSSCNRFHASFALTGERLEFSHIAGTMMLCGEEIMAQEQEFKRVLSGTEGFDIEGFDIEADGMLELRGSEGQLLARPTPPDE